MTELNLGGVPDWPTCHRDDCDGIRVDAYDSCLAHLPEEALTTVLNVFCPGSDVDVRGTSISAELLERLLARVQGENGRPQLGTARFAKTRISGRAWFVGACFSSLADFDEAHFTGLARFDGARFEGETRFSKAQFNGSTWFVNTRFNGPVQFSEAQFRMDVEFAGTWFGAIAYFGSAEFSRTARFSRAQFKATARFNGARFIDEGRFIEAKFHELADFAAAQLRNSWFDRAEFHGRVYFTATRFGGLASFEEARFNFGTLPFRVRGMQSVAFDEAQFGGKARFSGAQFRGEASFGKAEFDGAVEFDGAQFIGNAIPGAMKLVDGEYKLVRPGQGARWGGTAWFNEVHFTQAERLGPLVAANRVVFDSATFDRPMLIEAASPQVSCVGTTFGAGGTIRLRYAVLALDATALSKPTTVVASDGPIIIRTASAQRHRRLDETVLSRAGRDSTVRLASLRRVDVANLVITDVDLGPCQFAGAHHLDQLRIEGSATFTETPRGPRVGWAWPPVWWWTRRQALAEEHAWRATRPKGTGWYPQSSQPPDWLESHTGQPPTILQPVRLASLYRALRKAQEDSKNEPGAADFYYGEMEMRRCARTTPWGERLILWLYWLTSGYGLRGLRAVSCLAALVVGLGVLLQHVGFDSAQPPASRSPSLWASVLYTALSTLSLDPKLSDLPRALTWQGEVLRIILRLSGPVLLGLALLSVRNRVKR